MVMDCKSTGWEYSVQWLQSLWLIVCPLLISALFYNVQDSMTYLSVTYRIFQKFEGPNLPYYCLERHLSIKRSVQMPYKYRLLVYIHMYVLRFNITLFPLGRT